MAQQMIDRETIVEEALERVPNAVRLFLKHGFDPRVNCGEMTRETRLGDAQWDCGLREVDSLIEELNAALQS